MKAIRDWFKNRVVELSRQGKPERAAQVVLYTRAGCHLCDDAKAVLEKHGARFPMSLREVDVDADPALQAEHGLSVPVVEIDGVVRFRGRVNEVLLQRLLRQLGR